MTSLRSIAATLVVTLLVSGAASAGTFAASGPAAAQPTEIDSCTTISEPGHYVLADDIEDATGACIQIEASNVVFDGNGHTIDGVQNESAFAAFVNASYGEAPPASNETNATVETNTTLEPPFPTPWRSEWENVGIAANDSTRLTNVTVRDVTVSEFFYGAYYEDVEDSTFANVTATGNGDGIDVYNASSVAVVDSTFTGNQWGAGTTNVTASEMRNVSATENDQTGLYIFATERLTVANTSATDNGDSGVIFDVTNESTVVDTNASGNTYGGVPMFLSSNNTVRNLTASGNGHDGIAFYLNSTDNVVVNSTLANTTGEDAITEATGFSAGLVILNNSTDNRVVDTVAANNTGWGLYTANASANTTADSFTLADGNVTTSFRSDDVALAPAASPADPPAGYAGPGTFLNVTNTSADASILLNVSYDEGALGNLDEASLRLWVHEDGNWSELEGVNDVNTSANYVSANVTRFGIVALLGETTGNETESSAATSTPQRSQPATPEGVEPTPES